MENISPELIRALASGGVTVVLATVVLWFMRGDILSRAVYQKQTEDIIGRVVAEVSLKYQEMTESVIERVLIDVTSGIIKSVQQMLVDWENERAECDAKLHIEVQQLKVKNEQLVEELEWNLKDGAHHR